MNGDKHNGLDGIWPGIKAEIASARRQQDRRRRVMRVGLALGLPLAAALVVVFGLQFTAHSWAFHPWRLHDISSETGVAADYPLARGKRIFVVHGQGERQHVACIKKRTGEIVWTNALTFAKCRLAADNQRVYLMANGRDGNWICAALSAKNGATLWTQPASETPAGPPSTLTLLRNGLCWSEGNRVVLREPATGRLLWSRTVGRGGLLSAPVQQGTTLFTAALDQLHALNPRTGDVLWSQPLASHTVLANLTRPMLEAGAGRIFCASRDDQGKGVLRCIEPATRQVLWTRETAAPLKLHFHGERLFVRTPDLNAFDTRTGRPLWQAPVGGCGTLSFRGNRVYLVDAAEKSRVLALDVVTGKQVWTHAVVASCNGIVVTGHYGILSGNDRTLYTFDLNDQS